MKHLLIISGLLFLLTSCGTKVIKTPKKVTQDTRELDEFLQMSGQERQLYYNKQKILELYQKLRERERTEGAYVRTYNGHYIKKSQGRQGRQWNRPPTPKRKIVQKPKPTKSSSEKVPVGPLPKEKIIEVKQNLTMFCMAKRNDHRFKKEGTCPKYAQGIFEKCKEDRQNRKLKNIVYCVKSRLR